MSRTLVFGDIQVYPFSEFSSEGVNGSTRLLDLCQKTFKWLGEIAHQEKVDKVVCLGDVFDRPNPIDVRSLKIVAEGLDGLAEPKIVPTTLADIRRTDVYVILGNHDLFSQKHIHALVGLSHSTCISPTRVSDVVYLPFTRDISETQDFIDNLDWSGVHVAFSHNPILGYKYRGFEEKHGVDFSKVPKSVTLVHGHYHEPEILSIHGVKHIICGAPFARSFADGHKLGFSPPRGAMIFDENFTQVKRVDNPHSWIFETWDHSDPDELEREITKRLMHVDPSRLYLRVTLKDVSAAEKIRQILDLKKLGGYRVRVDSPDVILDSSTKYEPVDPTKLMKSYLEGISSELDPERLLTLGRSIVK